MPNDASLKGRPSGARRTGAGTWPARLLPRNIKAAQAARAGDEPLFVSFVGDIPWPSPTVYCDSGSRYDWAFLAGLLVFVVVRAGTDASGAPSAILANSDVAGKGYPMLVDLDQREVACIVHGRPIQLWQMKREHPVWQQLFGGVV